MVAVTRAVLTMMLAFFFLLSIFDHGPGLLSAAVIQLFFIACSRLCDDFIAHTSRVLFDIQHLIIS